MRQWGNGAMNCLIASFPHYESPVLSSTLIKDRARELKFDLCGIAQARQYPRLARLADWIERGDGGDMEYLRESLSERSDPAAVLPTVKSIISLAVVYNTA